MNKGIELGVFGEKQQLFSLENRSSAIEYEKPLPGIGKILTDIDTFLGPVTAPVIPSDTLLEEASIYKKAYARWEIVRHDLAKNVVGNTPGLRFTGAEKWGAGLEPEQVIFAEVDATGAAFDAFARKHKYDLPRISRLDKALWEGIYPNTEVLTDLELLLLSVRGRMLTIFDSVATSSQRQVFSDFNERVTSLASHAQMRWELDHSSNNVTQHILIPNVNSGPSPDSNSVSLSDRKLELHKRLQELGKAGNPVIRAITASREVTLALMPHKGVNFAFKGSKTLERIREDLAYSFLLKRNLVDLTQETAT